MSSIDGNRIRHDSNKLHGSRRFCPLRPALPTPAVVFMALIMMLAMTGCAGNRAMPEFEWDPATVIPLEEAQILITSGQVKEIFQPHEGCVLMTLHNGERRNFHQPYLDWVLDFLEEKRLRGEIRLSMQ